MGIEPFLVATSVQLVVAQRLVRRVCNFCKEPMDVLGMEAEIADAPPYELTRLQRLFLFTRSETLYGGSNQIQRNIISERALGLPREPRGQ